MSSLAKDLSGTLSNPYANLGVATNAAKFEAEQIDVSLANTLDTLKDTGAGAGGATALRYAGKAGVKPGMMAAVDHGTARRAQYNANEPILGKTGTCTDRSTPTHLGWFGSFNEVGHNKLVVVVLLTGGKPVNGPVAAAVAGSVYRNLSSQQFFAVAK